jgi:hypothetical protein
MVLRTARTFSLRVRCPYGDFDDWITVHHRIESLEQLCGAPFEFECPTHGAQQGFPLEGVEKNPSSSANKNSTQPCTPKSAKPHRSSERKPFHAPVRVYGWSKSFGTFHEDTTTLMFNTNGALVRMATPLELGENLFIVNKFTKEEQEVRVVFKDPQPDGKFDIGLAFAKPATTFWRKTRRNPRAPEALRVFVRGKDRNGNPFSQSSCTLDISEDGARLDNVAYLTAPGEIIEVKRRWHGKGRFRVAWIGQLGTSESNQVGIYILDAGKLPWRVKLAKPIPPKFPRKS